MAMAVLTLNGTRAVNRLMPGFGCQPTQLPESIEGSVVIVELLLPSIDKSKIISEGASECPCATS
jgi:hypothetical protein